MTIRTRYGAAVVALTVALAAGGTGCGSGGGDEAGGRSIPKSLRRAESAAEDSIDLILADKRAETIRSAAALDKLAQGELAEDLEGIATKEELGELQGRAAELARIAPEGEPIDVALAANRAFEPIARLFGRFESDVPGAVMMLDYYDFEAKLRAIAHEVEGARSAVDGLASTWTELVKTFPAGDEAAATRSRFEAHAATMASLVAAGTDFDGMAREAEHGLDLVDELEAVYES
jgi:hypothetical protein